MELLLRKEKEYKELKVIRAILLPMAIIAGIISIFLLCSGCVNSNKTTLGVGGWFFVGFSILMIAYPIACANFKKKTRELLSELEKEALKTLCLANWKYDFPDEYVSVKSRQSVDNYTDVKYFKDNPDAFEKALQLCGAKQQYVNLLDSFLENNPYRNISLYPELEKKISQNRSMANNAYTIVISYLSPKGRSFANKTIVVSPQRIQQLKADKSLIMGKGEYSKYLREQNREQVENKQREYYEKVNQIIDYANENREMLVIKKDIDELDKQIYALFDRTVNSIKRIKDLDSQEWWLIDNYITTTDKEIHKIVDRSQRIIIYYNSPEFANIKSTCAALMDSQKEFNEYIRQKADSIATLFGTKVVRNETVNDDKYNYIRPYKKSVTPFTAEVSAAVFASAENNPMEYIVKYFYPNKSQYPKQIEKLQLLIEELETLREAKVIIENYKVDYQKYLTEVPSFVMENDESGFYSKLGFADINEDILTVEYKFSYTSNGGIVQRSFTVPMTEDTIIELISTLQGKLTQSAFAKEQRTLMTSRLRQKIKERDNFTCVECGNSIYKEPNLLLEVDHIIPIAKGGPTEESNLQTLCWKCNRQKGSNLY